MILSQVFEFDTGTQAISCEAYGNGHINTTFLVVTKTGESFILQKINKNVFKDPKALMENIIMVTEHLRKTSSKEVMRLVPCKDGGLYHLDCDEEYWRMYDFVKDSLCVEWPETPEDMRQCGLALGDFINGMADFEASSLSEIIPRFHDTPLRYTALHEAIKNNVAGRVNAVHKEIEFALARESFAKTLLELQKAGDMPTRVTHNDSKLNNVLFHKDTREALCVIDLDTVMPGLAVTDFGDCIRFGASTAAEDETDLSKVSFSIDNYQACKEGFMQSSPLFNTCEIEHLPHGAKMMTLECGVRFLTDYLNGDTYFKIKRDRHNLDRCRTQFKLVEDMEKKLGI
jgi:Ser/Thr protein kinase RdoA (MazF antagonist)